MQNKNIDQAMNYYNSIKENTSQKQVTLKQLYETVKNGLYGIKDICIEIRKYDKYKAEDKKIQGGLKQGLPIIHIPMSANNPTKTLSNIKKDSLSGFVYFDIDNIPNLKDVKKELSNNSKISMVWYSASGTGLGVIVRCGWVSDLIDFEMDLNEQYQQITKYIWNGMGLGHIEIDPNANRINQVNYISYDSEAHYNGDADCGVAMPDRSIIKKETKKAAAKVSSKSSTKEHIQSQLSNRMTKDILDGLVAGILSDEKDLKAWDTTASGNSAIKLLTTRAIQYGIEPKDVLIYMQNHTKHSDKDKVYNLKDAESWSRSALLDTYYKKQLYTYSPILKHPSISIKKNQYLADVFDYKLFRKDGSEHVKAVIIASTGMGKNYAIVQNSIKHKTIIVVPYNSLVDSVIKDAQNINYTTTKNQILNEDLNDFENGLGIKAEYKIGELDLKIENINKDKAPIKFVRYDQYSTADEKSKDLSSNNLIITTNESLPKVISQLSFELKDSDIYKDYLLVVDEVHIYAYSKWKENAYTRNKPITDVLECVSAFDNVIAMTGTYSDNPIKAFDDFKVVKFRYEVEPVVRSFGYIQKGNGKSVDEDLKIVNYWISQGYFPIIYKNDKRMNGWLGDFKKTAKSTFDYDFADVNSDSKVKTPEYYQEVVIDRNIDKSKYDGVIITSIMKQGVSTNIKINEGEANKVVYIINAYSKFGGIDSDEIQQIANRVRNATEVCICLVYSSGATLLPINHQNSKFDYNYTLDCLNNLQNDKINDYNNENISALGYGMRKRFQKLEVQNVSIFRDGKFEMSDLYISQEVAYIRSSKEFSSPTYLGWLGFEKFGWDYLGLLDLNTDLVLCDHSEHQANAKQINIEKAADFADGVDFVCTMFDAEYNQMGISDFNKFLNKILKDGKLSDGLEIGDGFKKALVAAMSVQSKFKNIINYDVIKDLILNMTNNKASSKVLEMLNTYSIYKELSKIQKVTIREKLYEKCFEAIDSYVMPTNLFASRQEAINSLNLMSYVDLYPIVETNTEAKKLKFVELLVESFFEIYRKGKDKVTKNHTYRMDKIDLYDVLIVNGF